MPISDIPIFSMLRTRMQWHQERQQAAGRKRRQCRHAEFPAARPGAARFRQPGPAAGRRQVRLASTDPAHITGVEPRAAPSRPTGNGKYDVRPAGNAVNLEDEMMKVAANQMDYQAATSLYSRSMGLFQNRDRQALTEACHGLPQIDRDRGVRPARAVRPHAGDLGKHRQRGFDRAASRAPIRTGARSRPSAPRSIARSTRRPSRWAACSRTRATSASSTSRGIRPPTQNGYVKYPNVNSLVEMTDMREAQRSYEANLNVIGATRRMIQRTIDLLRQA